MLWAQAPEGIPRDLARQRAEQVSEVRYHLSFDLAPHVGSTSGREELAFHLKAPGSLLLDFREGTVASLKINGQEAPAAIQNGHIVLPAELLHAGENTVNVDFTAPIAP